MMPDELDPEPEPTPSDEPTDEPVPPGDPEPAEVGTLSVPGECDPWAGLALNSAGDGCVMVVGPDPAWIEPAVFGGSLGLLMLASLVVGQLRRS